jgi:hypothetical protein
MRFWLQNIVVDVREWWRKLRRRRRFKGVAQLESGADPDAVLRARKLVLVGPEGKPKWLRFACPCRCGDVIALNLMASHSPRWTVDAHPDGTLTVNPSVDAAKCGSHFWVRRSRIAWV